MYSFPPIQQGPKLWKTKGQICPLLSTRIRTLSPGLEDNCTLKCPICIFPTFLIYVGVLENCLNNISMFGCAPIQGTTYFLGESQIKSGSQSGTCALWNFEGWWRYTCRTLFTLNDIINNVNCMHCTILNNLLSIYEKNRIHETLILLTFADGSTVNVITTTKIAKDKIN